MLDKDSQKIMALLNSLPCHERITIASHIDRTQGENLMVVVDTDMDEIVAIGRRDSLSIIKADLSLKCYQLEEVTLSQNMATHLLHDFAVTTMTEE